MNKIYKIAILTSIITASVFFFFHLHEEENNQTKEITKAYATNIWRKGIPLEKTGIARLSSQKRQYVKGLQKMDNPNLYAEYHRSIRTLPGDSFPNYPANYRNLALQKAKIKPKMAKSGKGYLNWQSRGPGNIGGRSRGIVIDPDDATAKTWYIAAVGGGIWKTSNAGASWEELSPENRSLNTSCIAMAASDHNTMYVGTGEGYGNLDAMGGNGIWKTADRGATWTHLDFTAQLDFGTVNRLIIDPTNPDIVVAATSYRGINSDQGSSGIWRTTDGGIAWTKALDLREKVQQVIFEPGNFNIQYASVNGIGVYKSIDAGLTWKNSSNGIINVKRLEIAIAPTKTDRLVVSTEGGYMPSSIFISDDRAETWSIALDLQENVDFLGGQGWYDNAVIFDPYNENSIYVAGVNIFNMKISEAQFREGLLDAQLFGLEEMFTSKDLGLSFGGLGLAEELFTTGLTQVDYANVEIRFGEGKTQKAHRFAYGDRWDYLYKDYVDVPFEVWDVENNVQLMASFRDSNNDGLFDVDTDEDGYKSKEYIFIHDQTYRSWANSNIAKKGGNKYHTAYFAWIVLAEDATWDSENIPEGRISYVFGEQDIPVLTTTIITDGYGEPEMKKGVHVDHHVFAVAKLNEANKEFRLVGTNDGGVCYSDDKGLTFTQPITGFVSSQFYGVDKANGKDIYIGGMQDNSSYISPENPDNLSSWEKIIGGDGFECVYSYSDENKYMLSSQFNNIVFTHDGGEKYYMPDIDKGYDAPFLTKLSGSKQNSNLVFAVGKSGIWRTRDFGLTWQLIQMPDNFFGTHASVEINISLADPSVVWAGNALTAKVPVFLSNDGGTTFTPVQPYTDRVVGLLSGFATHPINTETAYALFSTAKTPKILKTEDSGQTWAELSGFGDASVSSNGFPDVAVYSLLVMPYNTDILWAGTEIGIFESLDAGATWNYANNGLPATPISDMKIVNNEVVIGTHGRGVWSVEIPELEGYEPPNITLDPIIEAKYSYNSVTENQYAEMNIAYIGFYEEVKFFNNGSLARTLTDKSTGTEKVYIDLEEGVNELYVEVTSGDFYFKSETMQVLKLALKEVKSIYSNSFNTLELVNDFYVDGFSLQKPSGFSDYSLQTNHPYEEQADILAYLLHPILVNAENSLISYKDIAIVETGDVGTVYGDFEFWDYVSIEASTNGNDWKPLKTPYDANYSTAWASLYNSGFPANSSHFVEHEVDLLDFFEADETVLLRFRLFSDDLENSWGWAIDDLKIQNYPESISENISYELNVYPNPASDFIKVSFDNNSSNYQYEILNLRGTVVKKSDLQQGEIISIKELPSSVYFLKLSDGNSKIYLTRFVKK